MTLILKLDLDMVKMYLHTKNEVSMLSSSKVIAWTDRNTDRHTDRHTDRQTDSQTDRHDWKHYLPTYAAGNDFAFWAIWDFPKATCRLWCFCEFLVITISFFSDTVQHNLSMAHIFYMVVNVKIPSAHCLLSLRVIIKSAFFVYIGSESNKYVLHVFFKVICRSKTVFKKTPCIHVCTRTEEITSLFLLVLWYHCE